MFWMARTGERLNYTPLSPNRNERRFGESGTGVFQVVLRAPGRDCEIPFEILF